MFAAFPRANGEPYDDDTVAVYAERLAMIPAELRRTVFDIVIDRHQKFLPTVAEIKDVWMEFAVPDEEMEALEWAVEAYRAAVRESEIRYWSQDVLDRGGVFMPDPKPPEVWRDATTREAVRRLGWDRLAVVDEWLRVEWRKAYAEARTMVMMAVASGHALGGELALERGSLRVGSGG
jgi:hypothetical protein